MNIHVHVGHKNAPPYFLSATVYLYQFSFDALPIAWCVALLPDTAGLSVFPMWITCTYVYRCQQLHACSVLWWLSKALVVRQWSTCLSLFHSLTTRPPSLSPSLPAVCDANVDMVFMLDQSGSVGRYNHDIALYFLRDVISFYNISPNATQVQIQSPTPLHVYTFMTVQA